jgi:hypothetical protein
VADPADLIVVTTGVDESDAGATPASPGGTGLSLREATTFASGQASRQTIFVPGSITSTLGGILTLNTGTTGFDLVGEQSLVDGQTLDVCLALDGPGSIRVLGLEIANCNGDGINIGSGVHLISRNQIHDATIGILHRSVDGGTIGPDNTIFSCGRGLLINEPVDVIGNTIRDNTSEGARVRLNSDNSMIRGNVFARNTIGVDIAQSDSVSVLHNTLFDHVTTAIKIANSASNVTVLNNILYTAGTQAIDSSDGVLAALDNNCYFNATPCSACTVGASSTTDDPLFIDEGVDDFRLQSTSTLIDQAVDTGFDVNGAAPGNFDGGAPDIGAHEMP